jgi:FixJ family two-component response regulator
MSDASAGRGVVLVVDDDASVRAALCDLFQSVGLGVEAFATPAELLRKPLSDGPRCLVLDVRLPGLSGLDFQEELARSDIEVPIIFITGHGDIPMTVRAMKAGAFEFLPKPFRDQDLLDAVQRALALDRSRREERRSDEDLRTRFEQLTPREQEVIRLVGTGLLNKQIAGELGVSEITVKVHRGNAMRKLGARTLADAMRILQALGLHGRT